MSPSQEPAPRSSSEGGEFKGLDAGEKTEKHSWGAVKVKNSAGKARSHIELTANWDVHPNVLFAVFTYPDNTKLFRDIRAVGQRKVVSTAPNHKVVDVEQVQELKVLWIKKNFSTWLRVTEDSRDEDHQVVTFSLLKSDVLSQFEGRWDIHAMRDSAGKVVGTSATLNQEILPRGVPPFLKRIPVMGDLLRAVTMRAINRVMEDIHAAVVKITTGMAKGATVQDMLRQLCGVYHEAGHANGAVASFAFDPTDSASNEDADEVQDASSGKGTPVRGSAAGSASDEEPASSVDGATEGMQKLHVSGKAVGAPGVAVPAAATHVGA